MASLIQVGRLVRKIGAANEAGPMLVLSRKAEESLVINDNIVVVILAIEGDRVKIGIQAPPEVTILRSEVRDRQRQGDPNAPPPPPRRPRRPAP